MQFAPLSQLFGFRRLIKRNVPCLENSRQIASWRPAIAIPSVDPAISTEKPVVERGARVRGRIRLRFALMIVLIANGSVAFAEGDAAGPGQQADQQAERKAICSKRLRQFIIEIDRQMETSRSSDLLQWTISRHFPLFGCDLDEAFAIVRQSKYFERVFAVGLIVTDRSYFSCGSLSRTDGASRLASVFNSTPATLSCRQQELTR